LILDVTEKLMVDEGYAAVSSRRIAKELGLNAATIHYYYPTTDDIFIALHKRMSVRQLNELKKLLAGEKPLQAFWEFQSGNTQTALNVEFLALANHRKAIWETLAEAANGARASQAALLAKLTSGAINSNVPIPPVALATLLVAIGRLLTNEERVGITEGHEEVRRLVTWAVEELAARDNAEQS
jgi:AcrR family transcriptional regulator